MFPSSCRPPAWPALQAPKRESRGKGEDASGIVQLFRDTFVSSLHGHNPLTPAKSCWPQPPKSNTRESEEIYLTLPLSFFAFLYHILIYTLKLCKLPVCATPAAGSLRQASAGCQLPAGILATNSTQLAMQTREIFIMSCSLFLELLFCKPFSHLPTPNLFPRFSILRFRSPGRPTASSPL